MAKMDLDGDKDGQTINPKQKPVFFKPLPESVELKENQPLHLETSYSPKDDNDLHINWYHNGMPLKTGSR